MANQSKEPCNDPDIKRKDELQEGFVKGIHPIKKASRYSKIQIEPSNELAEKVNRTIFEKKGIWNFDNVGKEYNSIDCSYWHS